MADLEATRKTDEAKVMYLLPDVCKTPLGAALVPVPYPIVGPFAQSVATVATVLFCKLEAFTMASKVQTVVCDEQGVGGGVKSGVHKAACEPIKGSSTVNAKGDAVVRHDDPFWMNNKNTTGNAVFPGPGGGNVSPSGQIEGQTNPEKKPDNPVEEKSWWQKTKDYASGMKEGAGEAFGEMGEFAKETGQRAQNIWEDPSIVLENGNRIASESADWAQKNLTVENISNQANKAYDAGAAIVDKAQSDPEFFNKLGSDLKKKAGDFLSDPKAVGKALTYEGVVAIGTLGAGTVLKKLKTAANAAEGVVDTANNISRIENKVDDIPLPKDKPDLPDKTKDGPEASKPVDGTTINEAPKPTANDVPLKPKEKYKRKEQYGNTPTKADRKALGAGPDDVVDHDPPLSQRYYEGDPTIGEKPGYQMTPEERLTSANDRSRMQLQPKAESHAQGGQQSAYTKKKNKEFGL